MLIFCVHLTVQNTVSNKFEPKNQIGRREKCIQIISFGSLVAYVWMIFGNDIMGPQTLVISHSDL